MRAEEMRALAEDAQDSTVRAMMLRIAADYKRLAENADDRAGQDSIMFRVISPGDKTSDGARMPCPDRNEPYGRKRPDVDPDFVPVFDGDKGPVY
jgi:hypothetical protein